MSPADQRREIQALRAMELEEERYDVRLLRLWWKTPSNYPTAAVNRAEVLVK